MKSLLISIFEIVPHTLDIIYLLFLTIYFFALIGLHSFGGMVNTNINFDQFNLSNNNVYLNFNNFTNSMIYCFSLLNMNSTFDMVIP